MAGIKNDHFTLFSINLHIFPGIDVCNPFLDHYILYGHI